MGFYQYLFKRIGFTAFSLFVLSILVFAITQVLPGSAATLMLGKEATESAVLAVEKQLGLNRPIYVQYLDWIGGFLTGDWGASYHQKVPIIDLVVPRLVRSLQLAGLSLALAVSVAIPLGVVAAVKNDSKFGVWITSVSYAGVSVPEFVTGLVLILLLGGPVFSVFPSSGYEPLSSGVVPWLMHIVLPAVTLTIILISHLMRQTRSELIDVLQSEYIRTARLKGISERRVLLRHALPNGLLPTITVIALDIGYLIGGIVIVEAVFAFPGIGRLTVDAILSRDIPLVQATTLVIAALFMLANLCADLLYARLDPRIEYGGGS